MWEIEWILFSKREPLTHLFFNCVANPTTLDPSSLWTNSVAAAEFLNLETAYLIVTEWSRARPGRNFLTKILRSWIDMDVKEYALKYLPNGESGAEVHFTLSTVHKKT
jgi:hypothetical protein